MSVKLYELAESYNNIWSLVDDDTMDLAVIEEALQSIEGSIQEKVQNVVVFVKSLDADAEVIRAEEKRLAERRRALENKRDGIKQYLQMQMEAAGLDKLKLATHTVSIQNNPPSVKIITPEAIPTLYLVPQEPVVDKKSILAALKAGDEVIGCELQQGRSLRIR